MEQYNYIFSIVIPIYNVEKYLEETINSIINQTIGFEKNIQLVLVNDGSKDNSEEICLKYKELYPENVVYVKQENAGVSAARNLGIKNIQGKYVNFLDGDDKWSLDALEKIYDFFEKNNEEIDIVVGRKEFFEAKEGYHILDYKFEETKVIDIFEDYDFVQMDVTSAIFKSDVVKKYAFNTNLRYAEDADFVNRVLLEKHKFGVIKEAVHLYRKRYDETSALQNIKKSKSWFTDTIKYFHQNIFGISKEKYGKIIPYVQYVVMYDLQWRLKEIKSKSITNQEKEEYIENIKGLLRCIDDEIIIKQKNIFSKLKLYALSLKYGKDITEELKYENGKFYYNNLAVYKIRNNENVFKVEILEIEDDMLKLEGRTKFAIPRKNYEIYLNIDSSKEEKIELKEEKIKSTITFEGKEFKNYTFNVEVHLKDIKKVGFIFEYKTGERETLKIGFGRFGKLSSLESSYYTNGNYLITSPKKNILIKRNTIKARIKYERNYLQSLKELNEKEIIKYRKMYFILKKLHRKPIWLISDRESKANDNGEHLFKYIQSVRNNRIAPYFLLEKSSEDFERIKKIGKVIKPNSLKHKIYFLLASNIISSQAGKNVIDIFDEKYDYIKDLLNFKFVFLQHGITKDNLSKWLYKFSKNIKLFVTAGIAEYESIINGDYGYTEKEVKLTGFPRYDKLIDIKVKKEKQIIIIPTWRKNIKGSYIEKTSESIYLDTFKNTEFFNFYNNLINDKRIIEVLKNNGYKCKFCLHPLLHEQYVDFKGNDYVEINHGFVDYQNEFAKNSLLITDYSSVFFDFAYLKKPVIYTQFDEKEFFSGEHTYEKGYFDYQKDGFGPVCFDYESSVKQIIKTIEKGCELDTKYIQRIDKFYKYHDNNNCKRVYEELLKLNII